MRLQKLAITLLTLLLLASGVYFASRSGTDPQTYSNDFNVYYFAARELIEGRDPYQNSLGAWTPYLYPPLFAEALIPLALLPLPAAAYLWFLISAASVLIALWMLARLTDSNNEESPSYYRLVMAAASLVVLARFVLDNFDMGQVNNVVMALSVAHIYLHSKNEKLASQVALALAVSIKVTPILLIAIPLAKKEWRFAARCAVMSAILIVLSFVPFGSHAPDAFRKFANRTIQNEQGFDLAYPGNQSIRGFLSRLSESDEETSQFERAPVDTLALTLSLALLVAAIIASSRGHNALAAAAPIFCCVVLLSPLAWKAHFVMLLLAIANLAKESLIRKNYSIALVLVAAFCLFNLTSPRIFGISVAEWADSHSLVFAGGALIFFVSVVIAWSNSKSYITDR